jgi:hypothetical protein
MAWEEGLARVDIICMIAFSASLRFPPAFLVERM